jgi:energy-coupling factor transporter ATP-binding protein EcfA2
MYLRRIAVKNIKCFNSLRLTFFEKDRPAVRRWTVLLGKNGVGKSTLLQAIAVALAGPGATRELLPVAEGWTRQSAPYGEIEAELDWTEGDAQLPRWPKKTPYTCRYLVSGTDPSKLPKNLDDPPTVPSVVEWPGHVDVKNPDKNRLAKSMKRLKQTAYAEGKPGWLACGYGPFRRLSGGSQEGDRILYAGRKSARFVTLFREDAALTNATDWLIGLYNTARDGDKRDEQALNLVKQAFAEDFLPDPATLHVDARSARLEIVGRSSIPFHDLSDGYRSMLALGLDLLRWIITAFPEVDSLEGLQKRAGVVLIDELDAHLHPIWQRQIGEWLPKKFPELQFIIATHSPFLAQVADDPGGNVILERRGEDVVVRDDEMSVSTWRADQILTELFGLRSTRSPKAERMLVQYMALSKKKRIQPLTPKEQEQLEELETKIPPGIEDQEDRKVASILRTAIQYHQQSIKKIE